MSLLSWSIPGKQEQTAVIPAYPPGKDAALGVTLRESMAQPNDCLPPLASVMLRLFCAVLIVFLSSLLRFCPRIGDEASVPVSSQGTPLRQRF